MNTKILITGGAGYIGSMLTTRLVNLGYEVYVVDKLIYTEDSLNHLFIKKNFYFFYGDVSNKKLLKKLINKVDIVIPLAALVGAPLCKKKPNLAIKINYSVIKFIVNNLKKNQKIIFPTTNSGYGVGEKNKFCDENSPLRPISLYGNTKARAEKEILKHKNSICFRLATVFGYSYRMRTDLLVNNLVYLSLKYKKIKIFEPQFRRNFIHISDVVEAFLFAVKNFRILRSNIYNLGLSSANITKLELVRKIKNKIKKLKIYIIKNQKDPDQRDYFVSNKKIERKGYKAKVSLEEGIEELIKSFKFSKKNIINNY
jgi:nucleoside-diphosphate-sugar epimerase